MSKPFLATTISSSSRLRWTAPLLPTSLVAISLTLSVAWSTCAHGQDPRSRSVHGLYRDDMPTGVIGRVQLERDQRLRGFFQPVEVTGPNGLRVALASDGVFLDESKAPLRAALLVGTVYRLKVSSIPLHEGTELYPTLEVIDRLYPPAEREHRFPIPIVLEQSDLEAAMEGEMVTRVIYLEDSQIADPIAYEKGQQRVVDASPMQDALRTADSLGRPMAILRIGSRVPDRNTGIDQQFLFGCPPWFPIKGIPDREQLIESGNWPRVEYDRMAPEPSTVREIQTPQANRMAPPALPRSPSLVQPISTGASRIGG